MNEIKRRKRRRRQKQIRRRRMMLTAGVVTVAVLAIVLVFAFGKKGSPKEGKEIAENNEEQTNPVTERDSKIENAEYLAATYDYDGAMKELQSIEGYDQDSEAKELSAKYQEQKDACVPVNLDEVTHIFYHSLVVDPIKCFGNQENDPACIGNNQWMTTISEFNKITQEMYDRGYVMVSIHDLATKTTDENGVVHFEPNQIMLPPDKKAFVLSLDDLSYYHSYEGYGYASKIILDENGKPTCEYIQDDGTTVTGAYDVVPLMDAFLEKHPDASYHGAKGIIALTGYNGILGYRTDDTYIPGNEHFSDMNQKWLDTHPDFDLEKERAEAKKVADAMKEDGWEFASHTWGHMRVNEASMERIISDTERWEKNVLPLVGETDTLIFAHGADLSSTGKYDDTNEKYLFYKQHGFDIFCNVDSHVYTTDIEDNYVHQGRRNLDGYRIYFNSIGEQDNISDLFDAKEIIDPDRPPVHQLT